MPEFDAVVAGHLCLDVIPSFNQSRPAGQKAALLPGGLVLVGPATFATGGPVSNTGLSLLKLGINTRLMGKVGGDMFGQTIQQLIAQHGPEAAGGMIVDPNAHSSYTFIISAPGVDRTFFHYPGPNDTFSAGDIRYELLSHARLFHFGYPPIMKLMYDNGGEQLERIFRQAKASGITTSLDTTQPDPTSPAGQADWNAIFARTLPHVDIFLPSIEELLLMTRRDTFEALRAAAPHGDLLTQLAPQLLTDVSDDLLALGVKIVALKLGHRGLYLRTAGAAALAGMGRARPPDVAAWANRELWAPCFKTSVVGTTGAGDAAIAGLLAGLLRGLPPEEAITTAVAVGACNVEAPDALGGVQGWEATRGRIAAGWQRHPLALDAPGWQFNAAHHLWAREAA
ncbi:MAG: hypothetical protein Kow0031_35370 [Anaerolineae bacterium]